MKFYLSTIAPDASRIALQYGLGVEIAEYCTAWNMDEKFPETDTAVREEIDGITGLTFHAPFNELFPCAIDPRARQLAASRYRQAIRLARNYGAEKIIIHGGYNPCLYYPVWYVQQSVDFWQEFLNEDPGIRIVLENVLETQPEMLADILRRVDDQRLGMCLDIGHVNAYSPVPVTEWLTACAPYIRHFHIHNNSGSKDSHSALFDGTIPMPDILKQAGTLCPDATVTLEVMEAAPSVNWLKEEHLI